MSDQYDRAAEQTGREHTTSLRQTGTGWTWGCSCGAQGTGRARTPGIANAACNRHVRAAYLRILRGLS